MPGLRFRKLNRSDLDTLFVVALSPRAIALLLLCPEDGLLLSFCLLPFLPRPLSIILIHRAPNTSRHNTTPTFHTRLLLFLRHNLLHNCFPHHIINPLRLPKLFPQTLYLSLKLCNTRTRCLRRANRAWLYEKRMVALKFGFWVVIRAGYASRGLSQRKQWNCFSRKKHVPQLAREASS
jgi:hypothetical protein